MKIDKGANIAVIVNRNWANLHAVKMFLKTNGQSQREARGVDDSHLIFAKMLDSEDRRGLWVQVNAFNIFIPWSEILAVVIAEEFSMALREEARKIGFTVE